MTRMICRFLVAAIFVLASLDWCECKAQVHRKPQPHRAMTNRGNARPSTKLVPSLQKILDEMPSGSQPHDGNDDGGTFARGRANEWLLYNLVGRSLPFKVHLADAKFVGGSSDGTYRGRAEFAPVIERFLSIGKVRSGGKDWNVYISIGQRPGGFFGGPASDLLYSSSIISNGVDLQLDEKGARRWRERIGKDVTLNGIVSGKINDSLEYRPHFDWIPGGGDKKPEGRLFLYFPGVSIADIDASKEAHDSDKQASAETKESDLFKTRTEKSEANVVASLQKILDAIPTDSQPRDDIEGTVELIKANEWLKRNLVGKPIEFKAHLVDAKVVEGLPGISRIEPGKYSVQVEFARAQVDTILAGKVRSGGADWTVYISASAVFHPFLDEATVRRLQKLRGKDVTIVGIVYRPPKLRPIHVAGVASPDLPRFSVRRHSR